MWRPCDYIFPSLTDWPGFDRLWLMSWLTLFTWGHWGSLDSLLLLLGHMQGSKWCCRHVDNKVISVALHGCHLPPCGRRLTQTDRRQRHLTKSLLRRGVSVWTNTTRNIKLAFLLCCVACVPASNLLSYWDIPMLSHACLDPQADDKAVHNTLIRILPSYSKIGEAFVKVFQHYGWTRAVLMARGGSGNPCVYGSHGIVNSFGWGIFSPMHWPC